MNKENGVTFIRLMKTTSEAVTQTFEVVERRELPRPDPYPLPVSFVFFYCFSFRRLKPVERIHSRDGASSGPKPTIHFAHKFSLHFLPRLVLKSITYHQLTG